MTQVINSNQYRRDIDGLRALAVLSVIIFHINSELLPGGFIGVDIFFVISGFLISQQLFRDLERNCFSLLEFYRRRIKRIAPALLVVVAVVVILAQFVLLPKEAEKVAESAIWSIASLANVYFWLFQDTGYFAASSNELPLLHLWSLGVEEQFYIFWPLILMAGYKYKNNAIFITLMLTITITSFAFGEYYFKTDPSFVYYMLPTRAGELLLGAWVAYYITENKHVVLSQKIASGIATIGIMLIVLSLYLLSEESIFPGFQAIAPSLGAAMIIFAGHYHLSFSISFLTFRPIVAIGLISYSAYLWHWPILAFVRYGEFEIDLYLGTLIFCLTLLLAWLTYRFVEQPARFSKLPAMKIFINKYFIPGGSIIFISLVAMKLDGYGVRWFIDEYKNELDSTRVPTYKLNFVCQKPEISANDLNNEDCIVGSNDDQKLNILLWGDSNASHYVGMLSVFAEKQNFQFRNIEVSACPPLLVDPEKYLLKAKVLRCQRSLRLIWPKLNEYDVFILSASWTSYKEKSEQFLPDLFYTINTLIADGKQVIVIGKVPEIPKFSRLCREKSLSFPLMNCNEEVVPIREDIVKVNKQLEMFANENGKVSYFDANAYLCPEGACSAYDEQRKAIYYNSSHLNYSGSRKLGLDVVKNEGIPSAFSTFIFKSITKLGATNIKYEKNNIRSLSND